MVVSEATRARTRRDKALAVNTPVPPEVQDALESSWANPRADRLFPPEREVFVTMDALKNFLTTMMDAISRQVSEQVRRAM